MTATDTQSGLLRAICERPHDMGLRLIYADWCDENGQEKRSEFIRVQIELSKPVQCEWRTRGLACDEYNRDVQPYRVMVKCNVCRERERFRQRERELWTSCDVPLDGIPDDWIPTLWADKHNIADAPVLHDGLFAYFRRGFVEHVSCTCADWLSHGRDIVLQTPVLGVEIDRQPAQFAGIPAFWRECDGPLLPMGHDIPRVIFRQLSEYQPVDSFARYNSWKDAMDDLSLACINLARTTGTPAMPRLEDVK